MASYKIQLKDENGNRQYPVSTTNIVVDANGVSVADLLDRKQPTLVSGVNIKTINGKTLLGEGDLVIEGGSGDGSASVETRVLYVYLEGAELTEEEKAYNKETYDKIANGENVQLVFDVLGIPITHAFYAGDLLFTCSVVVIEGSALYGQGRLFSDGNYEYEEGVIGGSSGESAESDVICVVWDDDTSDIPSNKEAYQKLAESINTVGKPAAVMVCVETGYRWGIAKYYWKSNVGGDIELTTPVTESGLYCVFTLTSEGVCTASYKQVDLGGGGGLKYFVERYVYMGETEEERTYNLESLAMAEQGVDILWAGMQGLQMTGIPGEWWVRLESEAFVTILSASMSIENGTLSWNMTNFCRQFAYGGNSGFQPYIKAFFDNPNWIYESACYGAWPIVSWEDAGGTSVRAYYFKNNMTPYYVEINADTGEVGEQTLATQS